MNRTPLQAGNLILSLLTFVAISSQQISAADSKLAPSGQRLALLIGNYAYADLSLDGVCESLDLLEQRLQKERYRVSRHDNLNTAETQLAVDAFVSSVPTNGVALVYLAGFGAHVDRQGRWYNLLRPVREQIRSDNDYRSRGLNIVDLLKRLSSDGGAANNLFFLDTCWDSPIRPESSKVFSGIHRFDVPTDSVVMLAAPAEKLKPLPRAAEPSDFARQLASGLHQLEDSIRRTAEQLSAKSGAEPVGKIPTGGIGPVDPFPVVTSIDSASSPGQVYLNSSGMVFRWCPAGRFRMGSEQTDTAATRDRTAVDVELTRGFWMGEFEVTQREYRLIMRKNLPTGFTIRKNAPIWGITESKGVTDFCKKLSDAERKAKTLPAGWEYACPTEAQWEYACRAGSSTAYSFGNSEDSLGDFANFADATLRHANPNFFWAASESHDGFAEELAPVGSFLPNAWGLRDMHGNVSELVADHLAPDLPGGQDPLYKAKKDGQTVIRGGSWCSRAAYCESSFRNSLTGREKRNYVGFRVVLQKQ